MLFPWIVLLDGFKEWTMELSRSLHRGASPVWRLPRKESDGVSPMTNRSWFALAEFSEGKKLANNLNILKELLEYTKLATPKFHLAQNGNENRSAKTAKSGSSEVQATELRRPANGPLWEGTAYSGHPKATEGNLRVRHSFSLQGTQCHKVFC